MNTHETWNDTIKKWSFNVNTKSCEKFNYFQNTTVIFSLRFGFRKTTRKMSLKPSEVAASKKILHLENENK
jgi:hypothetical protein